MDAFVCKSLTRSRSCCRLTPGYTRSFKRKAAKFAPFAGATAKCQQSAPVRTPEISRRTVLQQLAQATAALSLGAAAPLAAPPASEAYLVQFPVADLRNQYYLVCLTCSSKSEPMVFTLALSHILLIKGKPSTSVTCRSGLVRANARQIIMC